MTTPDIEPILDHWLGEGTDMLPDRSVEVVLRTVERTSQRRAFRTPWRFPTMNGSSRFATVAGAAVVVVFVVGGAIFWLGGSSSPPAGQPSPASSPSSTPSPLASAPSASTVPSDTTPLGLAIVGLDGTVRTDLALPPDAWTAGLSSDGRRVAFSTADQTVGFCGGCVDGIRRPAIVEAGAETGEFIYPSNGPDTGTFTQFAWAPDGSEIAFQAADESGNLDIYVLTMESKPDGVGGGTVKRMTTDPAVDEFPAWTPDGSTIVYANLGTTPVDDSGFSPTQEIWSVPIAGGEPRRLTHNDVADTQPDVAADGAIAYWSGGEIRQMAADGSNDRELASAPPSLAWFNPRWSPDGSKLAVIRYDPEERATIDSPGLARSQPLLRVVVVDLASGDATDVGTWRVASDLNPVSWTPDGQALLINRYDAAESTSP